MEVLIKSSNNNTIIQKQQQKIMNSTTILRLVCFGCCFILVMFTLYDGGMKQIMIESLLKNYEKETNNNNNNNNTIVVNNNNDEEETPTRNNIKTNNIIINDDDDEEAPKCSIYMAPSSIKGVTSMGIYTTRDILANDEKLLRGGPDGPSITILADRSRSDKSARFPHNQISWLQLWANYAWGLGHGLPDHIAYEAATSLFTIPDEAPSDENGSPYLVLEHQTTFGALPNHHCVLGSLSYGFPTNTYDDSLISDKNSASLGAYSYNVGRDWYVSRPVKAGEEIFLNYGHCVRSQYPDWIPQSTPTPQEYQNAAQILYDVATTTTGASFNIHTITSTKNNTKEIKSKTILAKILDNKDDTNPNVSKLLPSTFDEIQKLWNNNTKKEDEMNVLQQRLARQYEINDRSVEWLRTNGKCLEHLRSGPSTILPIAGRGGFAQHTIRKGKLIVPSPMIHVMDRTLLNIYNHTTNGAQIGTHLVLNYCFGHSRSTVLLCPSTNALLLNHCSSTSSSCRVNAKLRWSTDDTTSEEWRHNLTLSELSYKPYRGFMMEFIATRDIQIGDEVFIDYGKEWEDAWEEHQKQWKVQSHPNLRGNNMNTNKSAKEANDAKQPPSELIRGMKDLRNTTNNKNNHYSHHIGDGDYLFTGCQFHRDMLTKYSTTNTTTENWTTMSDEEIIKTYAMIDGSQIYFHQSYEYHRDFTYWPCSILRQEENDDDNKDDNEDDNNSSTYSYLVRIWKSPFLEGDDEFFETNTPILVSNYPRQSLHFFVESNGAADQYQNNVFRHYIGMDDTLFPRHWKNL